METKIVNINRAMVDDGLYPITIRVEDDGECIHYSWHSEQFNRDHEESEPSWCPLTDDELAERVRIYENADDAYIDR